MPKVIVDPCRDSLGHPLEEKCDLVPMALFEFLADPGDTVLTRARCRGETTFVGLMLDAALLILKIHWRGMPLLAVGSKHGEPDIPQQGMFFKYGRGHVHLRLLSGGIQGDLAFALETPDDIDDALLRLLDLSEVDLPKV